ncbi:hypothetical protein Poly30_24750 [Planctomycetes bacterium Poly30]|uniref:DUF4082 domain-containing protein n=1 Tax=Saltatorellus ferox TaxID=2528018 RepID=A0A518ES87_9BACT|nr:hypothetical protein Poly30_24750 [Planctomycetes bacterium Poly30]
MNLPASFLAAVFLGLTASDASSMQLTIDFSATNNPSSLGGLGSGQSFFPEDVVGYMNTPTLDLIGLSFWTGNLGGTGHATTYIAVYDGDPDTANLIGSSSNFVDTSSAAGLANYTELAWTFDSLRLNAGTEYWCVLSSSPMDVNPTNTVPRSLQEFDGQTAPNDAYRGTSIIANRAPHTESKDLRFLATFADPGAGLGTSYCTANPNSTGQSARIRATGSATAADNDVTLLADSLPQLAFCFFITSQAQGFVMNPGGSSGNLCLSGAVGRYVGSGQIQNSGLGGMISLPLDLTATPTPTGFVSVMASETWSFQAWYRDSSPSGPTSNFTDGYSVTFQ